MRLLCSIVLCGRNSHESYTGSVNHCIICIIVIMDHRSPGQSYLGHGRLSFWLSNLKRQYSRRNDFVLQTPIIGSRFVLNVGNRLDGYRSAYRGGNVKLKKKNTNRFLHDYYYVIFSSKWINLSRQHDDLYCEGGQKTIENKYSKLIPEGIQYFRTLFRSRSP